MDSETLASRIAKELGAIAPDPTGSARPPPPPVPDHELIRRIGGGSYGDVWLARSVTGQMRAIKIIWRRNFSSERPYEREFRGITQFEPISRMHPGVIHILHVGRDDHAGCFYYVMELADAANVECAGGTETSRPPVPVPFDAAAYAPRTLASDLKLHGRVPVIKAVSLGIQLADALGHIHRHGLVHRDVKPSNVIFVNGPAKLADIGLVTGADEARSFVGTEGFIPPEGPGTIKADLFGLGRLIYETATRKDRCEFPELPDDLDRWPKSERQALLELNEVLARACAPEARHRHASAADLAHDLNLVLCGRSVRHAYGIERRLRRATWTSAAALVLVIVAIFSNWFQRRQRELSDARAQHESALRGRAEAAENNARQQLHIALFEQARATVRSGELGQRFRALDAIRRAAAISNSVELRREALAALALPDLRFEREFPTGPGFTLVEIDPAFERIALGRGNGPVEIRSVSDQRLLTALGASTNLLSYEGRWSPDGRFLAIKRDHDPGGQRADLEVWEVADAQRVLLLRDVPWGALSFHPKLHRIMTGRAGGVTVWDLASGQEVSRFQLAGSLLRLEFAPDGERFAAVQWIDGRSMVLVNSATNGAAQVSHPFTDRVGSPRWHPSGRWVSAPGFDGTVQLMDSQTGETRTLGHHKAEAVSAEFSPDGGYLVSGGWDRELICWDLRTMQRAFTIGLQTYISQFRGGGQKLAVVVTDRGVQIHAFELPSGHREFAEDLGPRIRHARFSPDGRWLAASGEDRLGVWDLNSHGPGVLASEGAGARMFFAANGELLVSRDEACSRWQVLPAANTTAPPELQRLALEKPAGFTSLCVASNLVALTGDNGSRVVALDSIAANEGRWVRTPAGVNGVSPDARWLAIYGPYTPFLYVYRLPGLEQVAKLTNQANIATFVFSPLGDEVAVGSREGVEFWSTTTWQRTRELTNFVDILFAPDGQGWWLTRDFRTAALYDARTLEALLPLPTGTLPLALSPDGRHLAVSVDARRLQVWDLAEVRERLRELGVDCASDR